MKTLVAVVSIISILTAGTVKELSVKPVATQELKVVNGSSAVIDGNVVLQPTFNPQR